MFNFKANGKSEPETLDQKDPASGKIAAIHHGGKVSRALLKKAVSFANKAFPSDYAVSVETALSWIAKDPTSVLIALDQAGSVAAYASIFRLSRETYFDIVRGDLCDWDISDLGPMKKDGSLASYFYVGAVVVREDLRGSAAFKVMREAIMGQIKTAAAGDETFVACEILSEPARRAVEKMGLHKVKDALDGFPLYAGRIP